MKRTMIKKRIMLLVPVLGMALFCACSKDWLEPKAMSFYSPENTYVDAQGFYAALTACERNMRHEYFGDAPPIVTEMVLSDIAVEGTTDKAGPQMDLDVSLLPDANLNNNDRTKVGWYWYEGYKGIKYANIVITRIDEAEYKDEAERNAVLGSAYFHRAYRYYKLTHQFGNIPYLDAEIDKPKYDFYTYDRWSILERMQSDLEFAYQWVPAKVHRGKTSKAAAGTLLMKVCMSLGNFDRAIEVGKEIIAANPLMTARFTANATKPKTNLMHDLHSVEAKLDQGNTEGLMYVVSYPGVDGSDKIQTMRNAVPFWNFGSIRTPDGKTGTSITPDPSETDPELDLNRMYGRGIGRIRPTWFSQSTIWTTKEKNDLRGIYNRDSWKSPEDLRYNNVDLKKTNNPWYGKNFVMPVNMSVEDTIRCWYSWPHYKVFVPDPLNTTWVGGETPWYIYRTAEVCLMVAECYYWLGKPDEGLPYINQVRTRAGADPLVSGELNITSIISERARELFYEEPRKTELTRIAYIYAKTGKSCEAFGGRVYKLDNFSGSGSNLKQDGYNFYYDWVVAKSNFYNKGVKHKWAEYKISVHHVLWPVPANAINSNVLGRVNQNIGYPGAEKNVTPLIVPKEGTVIH